MGVIGGLDVDLRDEERWFFVLQIFAIGGVWLLGDSIVVAMMSILGVAQQQIVGGGLGLVMGFVMIPAKVVVMLWIYLRLRRWVVRILVWGEEMIVERFSVGRRLIRLPVSEVRIKRVRSGKVEIWWKRRLVGSIPLWWMKQQRRQQIERLIEMVGTAEGRQ